MLDLAPHNPYGLALAHNRVARLGWRGAGLERLIALGTLGAIISDPLVLREGSWPGWLALPGGVLWPDGGRDIRSARRDLRRWTERSLPVLVALQPHATNELNELLDELDPDSHTGLVLDVTMLPELAGELVSIARRRWRSPLLLELPAEPALVGVWEAVREVDAFVVARGPVAVQPTPNGLVRGRSVGPLAEPTILATLLALRGRFDLPILVGASTDSGIAHAHTLGATAILEDVTLWINPA